MIIILSGSIGQSGLGGQAWVNLQYLLGFRELGHEVYYLEDCGDTSWSYHWESGEWTSDIDYPAAYVGECLDEFGLTGKWMYRAGDESRGMRLEDFRGICSRADVLIFRALFPPVWRGEYELPARRVFIDVDPGYTQIAMSEGRTPLANALRYCERFFTVGQLVGVGDCPVPTCGVEWVKTFSPVFLPEWPAVPARDDQPFSALMRWGGFRDEKLEGKVYGQKGKEFPAYLDLPALTGRRFRIALIGDVDLAQHGWETVRGELVSRTPDDYRHFIRQSAGEFGVAKEGYVRLRSGWFSDRSACYLASGRPVLVQETGISDVIPTGTGIVTFSDIDAAARAVADICERYGEHCAAARAAASQMFSSRVLLPAMLQ